MALKIIILETAKLSGAAKDPCWMTTTTKIAEWVERKVGERVKAAPPPTSGIIG